MPDSTRRSFLKQSMAIPFVGALPFGWCKSPKVYPAGLLVPPKLRKGQTIGIIAPASAVAETERIDEFAEYIEKKGFKPKLGKYVKGRDGYLAGTDAQRAEDLNGMFADGSVDAIICIRGGWGGARLLPDIDYEVIKQHPKILLGYSDVTSLLLGIHAKTGLITFHGPVGLSDWNFFTRRHLTKVLMNEKHYKVRGARRDEEDLVKGRYTITGGKATGRLLGGNLSVLCGMVGSPYLPDFTGAILLLEDVGEAVYRIDRYLTQLKLAGILDQVAAVVFSSCNECLPEDKEDFFTLENILFQHLKPLNKPAFYGMEIGHLERQYTLPIGANVVLNADKGFVELLHPAVK